MRSVPLAAIAVAFLALFARPAGAESIDVKPGLWERTVTMQMAMELPPLPDEAVDALATDTPEPDARETNG